MDSTMGTDGPERMDLEDVLQQYFPDAVLVAHALQVYRFLEQRREVA
jgi:hypothetical protein